MIFYDKFFMCFEPDCEATFVREFNCSYKNEETSVLNSKSVNDVIQ